MSEETKKIELGREGLYDARKLGVPKMLVLGVQHTFAMFGATVLVPILTGISVSTALLFAGIGTLLFHLLTKGKVPAFLGSSFAFLGGYAAVAPLGADGTPSEMLPYAAGGIVVSGLIYVILSALIKVFGVRKIMRFFPPVVTGPIIISIGLILAPSAITNCQSNWLLAFIALAVIVVCNIWGKGMVNMIPNICMPSLYAILHCMAGDTAACRGAGAFAMFCPLESGPHIAGRLCCIQMSVR